jgi:hypothetical protein
MLSTKNIKLKARKLAPKYVKPFKILQCVKELAYKLKLLILYNRLYLIFYISLLEEYVAKKGQKPYLYPSGELPELLDDNKEQEWEVEAIVDY